MQTYSMSATYRTTDDDNREIIRPANEEEVREAILSAFFSDPERPTEDEIMSHISEQDGVWNIPLNQHILDTMGGDQLKPIEVQMWSGTVTLDPS